MREVLRHLWHRRWVRFVVLGGVAAAANWGSRFVWSAYVPFSVAVVLAYVTGMVVAFVLFRRFVFRRSPRALHAQAMGFLLVNLAGLAQVWLVSMALAGWLLPWLGVGPAWAETLAHSVAIAVPVASSFAGHHYFSFKGYEA